MISPDEAVACAAIQLGIGLDDVSRWVAVIELQDGTVRATASAGSKAAAVALLTDGIKAMTVGEPYSAGDGAPQ